jgi:hypothetical protein
LAPAPDRRCHLDPPAPEAAHFSRLARWPARCKDRVLVEGKHCPIMLGWLVLACWSCATSASGPAKTEPSSAAPAPWQGPLADRMNREALEPSTPALRGFRGQAPLVYVARVPARGTSDEPAFELALFDDGTLVYEGHRCVEVGGVIVTRLRTEQLARVQDLLSTQCVGLGGTLRDDELCGASATTHLACSDGERIWTGTDHCRGPSEPEGQRVEALVAALSEQLALGSWLGTPTRRQACTPGSRDLSPHELRRTIRADLARAGP